MFYKAAGIPQFLVNRKNGHLRIERAGVFSNATLGAIAAFDRPWEPVATQRTNHCGRWVVLEPMTNEARFFRLRVR